jgi:hypothetical protein
MLRSLSERDRNRFAQLLQAPLIKPDQSPKDSGVQRFAQLKSVLPLTAMKRHFAAHYRGWATGAVAVAGLAILMVAVNRDFRGHGSAIQLKAMDQKGRLQIRWNPDSDAIRRAVAAKLYIIDGSERLFVKLDDARLRLGNVNYARSSARVELRMELAQPDGKRLKTRPRSWVSSHPLRMSSHWKRTTIRASRGGLPHFHRRWLPSDPNLRRSPE